MRETSAAAARRAERRRSGRRFGAEEVGPPLLAESEGELARRAQPVGVGRAERSDTAACPRARRACSGGRSSPRSAVSALCGVPAKPPASRSWSCLGLQPSNPRLLCASPGSSRAPWLPQDRGVVQDEHTYALRKSAKLRDVGAAASVARSGNDARGGPRARRYMVPTIDTGARVDTLDRALKGHDLRGRGTQGSRPHSGQSLFLRVFLVNASVCSRRPRSCSFRPRRSLATGARRGDQCSSPASARCSS